MVIEIRKFGRSDCSSFKDFITLNREICFLNISRIQRGTVISYESTSLKDGCNKRPTNLASSFRE